MAFQQQSTVDFVGTSRILNLPDGLTAQEPATVAQLGAVQGGIAWKTNVRAASTVNITLAAPGATMDTVVLAAGDRLEIKDQTLQRENGLYIWNGPATPLTRTADANTAVKLESAVVTVDAEPGASNGGTTWRQTQVNGVIDVTPIIWTPFGNTVPAATETVAGVAELATQAETNAGTDDARIITPLKLANSTWIRRLADATIGDGVATSYTIAHNLGSRGVAVTVYRNSGNFDDVGVEIQRPTINTVTLVFSSAPTLNSFNVLVTR